MNRLFSIVQKACVHHKAGRLKQAEKAYRKALSLEPSMGQLWNALGVVLEGQGRIKHAKRAYLKAFEAKNPYLKALFNLGRLYQLEEKLHKAINCYETLIKREPGFSPVWNSLGEAFRTLGSLDKALSFFNKAVSIDPGSYVAWNNLGVVLDQLGNQEGARKAFERAIELEHSYCPALFNLAQLHHRSGNMELAKKLYKRVLEIDPEDQGAFYLLKSLEGSHVPNAAPASYVKDLFDNAAQDFDKRLVDDLEYRTPQLMFSFLRPYLKKDMVILDLGCGTGLGSENYVPYAQELIGMDISKGMLKKALERGTYHVLLHQDILSEWKVGQRRFHLIYCCDTLVYIGELESLFSRVRRHLLPNGIFAFTVEEYTGQEDYVLLPTGRFAHNKKYLDKLLKSLSFKTLFIKRAKIRQEDRRPVKGLIVVVMGQ